MQGMQQRLAVASVLVLVMLAGTSALLIQHNAYGQNQPKASSLSTTHESSSTTTTTTTTNSTSISTGGSLLATGNHNQTGYGDDHETSTETQTQSGTTSTLDD
jgi:hypothetical protein